MKNLFCAFALLCLWGHLAHGTELETLDRKIRETFPGPEWDIATDWDSITITRRNVQYLMGIGLPRSPDKEEVWKQFSQTKDYRITISLGTKFTESEYQELLKLQRRFYVQRVGDEKPSKGNMEKLSEARRLIDLPRYYLERYSVHLYASDEINDFLLRPESAAKARDKVIAFWKKPAQSIQRQKNQNDRHNEPGSNGQLNSGRTARMFRLMDVQPMNRPLLIRWIRITANGACNKT